MKLLLLDGHSLAYRAFYALPPENFSTSTGQHTNAVYGFTAMLINMLRDEEPTHLAVAFDVSRQTFRSEEYPDYKATRSATPSEFTGQVGLLREVLDALNIRHVEVPGFEADDVIATLTRQARDAGLEVSICTGDRDSFQLVSDSVTVLYPIKGVSEMRRMDPATVEDKYLVPPNRYSDLAALVGESSDNLPGVPGVGPKTAAKWLTTYGDLTGIVTNAGDLPGKAGASLRDHLDSVLRNRRLNQLVDTLELPVTIEELARQPWDRERVHTVFDGLEFRVLRDRLFATFDEESPDVDEAAQVEGRVLDPDEVAAWFQDPARTSEPHGVAVTGSFHGGSGEALAVSVAASGAGVWVDLLTLGPDGDAALNAWLTNPAASKVMHDAKPQIQALSTREYEVTGLTCDTALAAYLVRPDQRSYDLADLVVRNLGRELGDEQASGQGTLDFGDSHEAQTSIARAAAIADLAAVLTERLAEIDAQDLLASMELPLVDVLATMERTGIAVDLAALEALEADFADKMRAAQQDAYAAIGRDDVNLGSPKQLQEVLFDQLGMPKTKKTKTGYTTDADALADLYAKTEHPFLEALLRHRDTSRLRVTVEGLIKSIAPDGRIHTTYLQTVAATGRLSSTDPNLQNVPIRTQEGRRIREAFVVGPGFESLVSADYSQIEMRIMAHLSQDAGLIEAFRSGEDLHNYVGASVFEVEPEAVTLEMRGKVKAMSYGLAYGLSAYGLSKQLAITPGEAQGLMDDYFERFGGVRDYLRHVVDEARSTGYTETMFGRRRYLPDLTSDNRARREMAERMALNAPIQGSAADVIKVAMLNVDRALRAAQARSRVLLQVHDELVLEVAPGESDTVIELVRTEMESAVVMDVPLAVNIGVGDSWHAAAH